MSILSLIGKGATKATKGAGKAAKGAGKAAKGTKGGGMFANVNWKGAIIEGGISFGAMYVLGKMFDQSG